VVIDGGPGQLNAAVKGIAKATSDSADPEMDAKKRVALCALAKNPERIFVQGNDAPLNETDDSPALLLLRSLRDESHRFALAAHRKRRSVNKSR
jgi:excinuclease ABC subunit C